MARVNLTYVFLQIFLTILFVFLYDSCYAFSYPKVLWRALVILTLPQYKFFQNSGVSDTMNVTGIIAEYNPFHNGHAFHIEETRKNTDADYCIAVISGDFVQRGAPALLNKYDRAKMALENGIDLVIE